MKPLALVMRIANALVLLFLAAFLLAGSEAVAWNIAGVFMIVVLLANIWLASTGESRSRFAYVYLWLIMLSWILLPFYNYLRMMATTILAIPAWPSYALVMLPFALGILLPRPGRSRTAAVAKGMLFLVPAVLSGSGVVLALLLGISLLTGKGPWMLGVFLPPFAAFFAFPVFACAAVAARSLKRWKALSVAALGAGGLAALLFLLPLLLSPLAIHDARAAFAEASRAGEQQGFRKTELSLAEYFLAPPLAGCAYEHDVVFYEGEGITLKFDVYSPGGEPLAPTAQRPGLLRIHGGAWSISDKGMENDAAMNVHFAGQGYVVFDLQYGLNKDVEFMPAGGRYDAVAGDFSIDDMIRHLSLFLAYLVSHAADYAVDPAALFVSGGSAGGQLATALVLAETHPAFGSLIPSSIHFIGAIPFYPANGLAYQLGLAGTRELVDPQLLLTTDSPPFLIYQGTHDSLVNSQLALAFAEAFRQKSASPCLVLLMPLAGHGSDLYFYSHYNQIFLYYMERFMHLTREAAAQTPVSKPRPQSGRPRTSPGR